MLINPFGISKSSHSDKAVDSIARRREERTRIPRRDLKRFGILLLVNVAAFVLMLPEMPAEALWPYVGLILGITLLLLLVRVGVCVVALMNAYKD